MKFIKKILVIILVYICVYFANNIIFKDLKDFKAIGAMCMCLEFVLIGIIFRKWIF